MLVIKKAVPKGKYNKELSAGVGDSSSFYPLLVDDDLRIGVTIGGYCSMNNHTLSQHSCDSYNGNVNSVYSF